MNNHTINKINSYGILFRFITPVLLAVIGTLILGNLSDIHKEQIKVRLDLLNYQEETRTYNINHLEHHRLSEVLIESRLTKIETLLQEMKSRR